MSHAQLALDRLVLERAITSDGIFTDSIGADTSVILANPYMPDQYRATLVLERLDDLPNALRGNYARRVKKILVTNYPELLPRFNQNSLFAKLTGNYNPDPDKTYRPEYIHEITNYALSKNYPDGVRKLVFSELPVQSVVTQILSMMYALPVAKRQKFAKKTYEALVQGVDYYIAYESKRKVLIQRMGTIIASLAQNEQFVQAVYQTKKRYLRTHQ